MEATNLEGMKDLVTSVAAEHAAAEAAKAAELAAEEKLLESVVEMVRPALRALSTRPRVSYTCRYCDDQAYTSEAVTRAEWAGVWVAGTSGPDRDEPRDNAGAFEGWDLFLRPDGSWVRLGYSGRWSRWQGSTTSWESEEQDLDLANVAKRYDVDEIVEALKQALTKASGTRAKVTKAAAERTSKLTAVVQLLK